MKNLNFALLFALLVLASCKSPTGPGDECPEGGPPCPPDGIDQIALKAPLSSQTYWDDQPLSCEVSVSGFSGGEPEWFIDGEAVACVDGEFVTTPAFGEHTVKVAIGSGDSRKEQSTTITVKEGFSVTLDKPKSGAEFFVGDKVSCSATITPEEYEEYLQITVDGKDCTDGEARLEKAGDLTVRAFATIDGRTEAEEATVTASPEVAGRVYPKTDRGVAGNKAGFTVYLDTPTGSYHTSTDADGRFRFSEVSSQIYEADELTLQVGETSDFYGARAELETYVPWTPDGDGVPISAGEQLYEITGADSLGFVLAPKRWRIRCGPLSGESTWIKLPEAFKRYNPSGTYASYSSFYMLSKVVGEYMYRRLIPENRPLPVAFNHKDSEVMITAADSTAFWQELESVEEKICRGDLFTPTTIAEVPEILEGVQVAALSKGGVPFGGAASDVDGYLKGGFAELPIDRFGPKNGSLAHEMTQVLGFGETSEWVGIMSSGVFSGDHDFTKYSVDDIAHIQLYMDVVDLQAEKGVSFGVYEWRQMFDIPSLPDN